MYPVNKVNPDDNSLAGGPAAKVKERLKVTLPSVMGLVYNELSWSKWISFWPMTRAWRSFVKWTPINLNQDTNKVLKQCQKSRSTLRKRLTKFVTSNVATRSLVLLHKSKAKDKLFDINIINLKLFRQNNVLQILEKMKRDYDLIFFIISIGWADNLELIVVKR